MQFTTIDPTWLADRLTYNSKTGEIRWKTSRPRSDFKTERAYKFWLTVRAGQIAFNSLRYNDDRTRVVSLRGCIDGTFLSAHRLAWMLYYGEAPAMEIDHINGNPMDNRIENLRLASRIMNNRNKCAYSSSRTEITGVHPVERKSGTVWTARIGVHGMSVYLGTFKTMDDAITARAKAMRQYGFNPNHGRPNLSIDQMRNQAIHNAVMAA